MATARLVPGGSHSFFAVPVAHRNRPNVDAKCSLLVELDKLKERRLPHAQAMLCTLHKGLLPANLSRWNAERRALFDAQDEGYGSKRTVQVWSRVRYPEAEDEVYMRFLERREFHGLETDDQYLCDTMLEVLED